MKKTISLKKRILSFILVIATLVSVLGTASITSVAAPTCYQQGDSRWGGTYYGSWNLAESGCGILSTVNAVNYLTGNFIPPTTLAQWGYSNGYYNGAYGQGTVRATFYANVTAAFGGTYGFKVHDQLWSGVTNTTLINHLKNGGAAIVHVPNHFMAINGYNTSTGQYLVYDSAAAPKRGTTADGTWLTAAQLNANSLTKVDWFCLVTRTGAAPTPTPDPTPTSYTINTSVASGQGSVHLGDGVTSATATASQIVNYQVTPAAGYKATKILVYGTPQTIKNDGADAVYQFTMEAANCNIVVTFEPITVTVYTINTSVASGQGSVHLGNGVTSASATAGQVVNYQVTPAEGYKATKILVYGTSQTIQNDGGDYVYQFTMEAANCNIVVTFEATAPTIFIATASVASGEGVVHFGDNITEITVGVGQEVPFQVTPATGYKTSEILVGGTAWEIQNDGADCVYWFTMPAGDCGVVVKFEKLPVSYTAGVYEIISTASLNVRKEPINGETLGYLPTGTRITALEIVNDYWAKFIYKGQIAYCSVNTTYATQINTSTVAESDIIFDNANAITWVNNSGVSASTVTHTTDGYNNSYMKIIAAASNDPQVNLNFAALGHLNASDYKYMVITARTSAANKLAKMYLCPGTITGPTEDCAVNWSWTNDGMWHDYLIDLSAISNWTGNVNLIRFDYFDGETSANSSLDVRSIKFYTSKPSTATVTTNKTNYTVGESITLSFSGLDSYFGTLQNQTPFVGIYSSNTVPGSSGSIMYTYVNTASGTLTFPADATSGTSIANLPAGSYTAWVAYDANGTAGGNNLNNVHYAGSAYSYAFTVSEAVVTDTSVIDKVGTDIASGSNSAVIKVGTSVSATLAALQTKLGTSVTITKDGAAVDSTAVIATGMVVTAGSTTYTVVVKGDVDCDGTVTIADAAAAMAGLRGTTTLSSASKDAAKEVSGKKGTLSILDVMALLNAL